ncbi:MAG: alanine racemase [Acetobacteraceae bacterium]|nr:alanine racemase [Acetobacteraceae bacterium]MCX7684899.1 alanine racemase [Acetobacteraceae bacterium]MDW8398073.1 alanine racemase [Acetobacteraceae bacterium]
MATDARAGLLSVDLSAVVANWRLLRERHQGGEVAAVVKADAYGLGAAPVGRALRDAGCRTFFVAHLAEGMALRQALGHGPAIVVLNGFRPGADEDAALWPALNSLADVEAWADSARVHGMRHKVLLHLDTGMARLGLDSREAERLIQDPWPLVPLDLRYVMTHLACADEPDHPLNAAQAARFAGLADRLPAARRSVANSSGIFLGPAFASDLARPGAALYGINPTPGRPNPMRQVVRLTAPILQLREIAAGESVGYGASFTATRPSRIATVAAGYADGYLRALSGRSRAVLDGAEIPLVGRVSMDLLTFDVTDAPAAAPGRHVTLIGDGITPDELAAAAGTIGYEILTSLGPRYRRIHA